MKNLFKSSLVAGALLALLPTNSFAAIAVTNWTGAATNSILTTNVMVTKLQVAAGTWSGGGVVTVNFYDNNVSANTYTNAAYTSYSTYTTNYSYVITNSQNFLQTNYYPALVTTTNTVVANTNTLPAIATFVLLSGTSETRSVQLNNVKGLTASAANGAGTNITAIVEYIQTYP